MVTDGKTRIIIEAIKDWMKRNPGKLVPAVKIICEGMELTESDKSNYTHCKRQAFKQLERAGYKLSYLDNSHNVACVEGFSAPDDVGHKVAGAVLGIKEDEGEPDEYEPAERARKPEKRPNTYLYIHKFGISPKDCAGYADFVAGVGRLPEGMRLEIKILVKELEG